jgi:hypothetical protein
MENSGEAGRARKAFLPSRFPVPDPRMSSKTAKDGQEQEPGVRTQGLEAKSQGQRDFFRSALFDRMPVDRSLCSLCVCVRLAGAMQSIKCFLGIELW